MAVRVGQRVRHLARDARGVAHRQPPVRAEELAQGRPIHAPHDDVEDFLVAAHLVDRHDVRVLELRDGARLAHEPLGQRRRRGEIQVQDLYRDVPAQREVTHSEHGGKAALPEERAHGKFRAQGLLQTFLEGSGVHDGGES